MWLNYGVLLVWVVFPETRTLDIHPQDGLVFTLGDTLDCAPVLPGFPYPVSDIFDT